MNEIRQADSGSNDAGSSYTPPDPTLVETSPEALDFWSRTLAEPAEKIRRAVERVGPVLERVKQELGQGGVG